MGICRVGPFDQRKEGDCAVGSAALSRWAFPGHTNHCVILEFIQRDLLSSILECIFTIRAGTIILNKHSAYLTSLSRKRSTCFGRVL